MSTTKYVVIDTETSGLGKIDTVLQLAYEQFDGAGNCLNSFCKFFRPAHDYEIHPEAAKVNNLTKAYIDLHGEHSSRYYDELRYLRALADDGSIFVGHNISFDLRIINQDLMRYGVGKFEPTTYCTKNNGRIREWTGISNPSLLKLYTYFFNEIFDGAHDALADVKATARCFFELKRLGIVAV